jgi:FixJ family two-component response regulator
MLSSHVLPESCIHLFSDNPNAIDVIRKICNSLKIQLQIVSDVEELQNLVLDQPVCVLCSIENDKQQVFRLLDSAEFDTLVVPVIVACSKLNAHDVIQLMEQNVYKILRGGLEDEDVLKQWIQKALIFEQDRINLINNYNQTNMALEKLSLRQLQVLKDILRGKPTKTIATHLKLSQRMIEKERSFILSVFGVNSTSEVTLKIGEYRSMKKLHYRIDSAHDTAIQIQGHLYHSAHSPLEQFLKRFGEL